MFYFKHLVGAPQILTFIDNPDVDNIDDAIVVLASNTSPQKTPSRNYISPKNTWSKLHYP